MKWFDSWALTLAVFLPLAGALVLAVLPAAMDRLIRVTGMVATFLALLAGVVVLARFDYGAGRRMQFEADRSWIEAIGTRYHLGIDGISLPLLVMSLLLCFLCAVYSSRILPSRATPGRSWPCC